MGNRPSIPKHTRYIESDENIKVSDLDLKIIDDQEFGVYTNQFIPAGTIIHKINFEQPDDLSNKINDLNYSGDASKYLSNTNNEDKTNIGLVKIGNELEMFELPKAIYLEALRDIHAGEELSRFYDEDFWYEKEFVNKYGSIIKSGELPDVYTYIDSYRENFNSNNVLHIYGKKVDDKYYYAQLMGNTKTNYYHKVKEFGELPVFKTLLELESYFEQKYGQEEYRDIETQQTILKFVYLIDRTKSDNSKYELNDYIAIDNLKYYSLTNLNSRPKKYFENNKEMMDAIRQATDEEKATYSWEIKREVISL